MYTREELQNLTVGEMKSICVHRNWLGYSSKRNQRKRDLIEYMLQHQSGPREPDRVIPIVLNTMIERSYYLVRLATKHLGKEIDHASSVKLFKGEKFEGVFERLARDFYYEFAADEDCERGQALLGETYLGENGFGLGDYEDIAREYLKVAYPDYVQPARRFWKLESSQKKPKVSEGDK